MTQLIQAIYEQGVFRPLQPVQLAEHAQVSLVVAPAINGEPSDDQSGAAQPDALSAALDAAAKLPLEGPDDGFSGADHDLVLYGWKK